MAKIKNSDSEKIKQLIKKVKVMAERGDKGEREVARAKLNELTSKYQITKFEENKKKKRSFKLLDFNDCKTIMTHCILDTCNVEIEGSLQKKELYCVLTDEQYIKVCEKFNHYYPEFYKQREAFIKAFIIKNDLGIDKTIDSEDNSASDVLDMMGSVKKSRHEKFKELVA